LETAKHLVENFTWIYVPKKNKTQFSRHLCILLKQATRTKYINTEEY